MALEPNKIVSLVIGLLLLGILLPIGLTELEAFTSTNASVETLVTVVIPICAVVGLLAYFLPKARDSA